MTATGPDGEDVEVTDAHRAAAWQVVREATWFDEHRARRDKERVAQAIANAEARGARAGYDDGARDGWQDGHRATVAERHALLDLLGAIEAQHRDGVAGATFAAARARRHIDRTPLR